MKRILKVIVLLVVVLLLVMSFRYNRVDYIANKNWKYYGGVSVGDMIETSFDVNGDINIESGNLGSPDDPKTISQHNKSHVRRCL